MSSPAQLAFRGPPAQRALYLASLSVRRLACGSLL